MKRIFLLLLMGLCFSLPSQAQSIVGNWRLSSMIVEGDMAYMITAPVTLKLDEHGKFSGNGGCNAYSGSYSFRNPKKAVRKTKPIKFSELISTKMSCQDTSHTEEAFFSSLREAATVVFDREELVIKSRPTIIKSPHGNILIQNIMTFVRDATHK